MLSSDEDDELDDMDLVHDVEDGLDPHDDDDDYDVDTSAHGPPADVGENPEVFEDEVSVLNDDMCGSRISQGSKMGGNNNKIVPTTRASVKSRASFRSVASAASQAKRRMSRNVLNNADPNFKDLLSADEGCYMDEM